jgi:iron complex outermembrane receptor protein
MRKNRLHLTTALWTSALTGVAFLASQPAFAQTAAATDPAASQDQTTPATDAASLPPQGGAEQAQSDDQDQIVVTGSRITTAFNSPSPVEIIDPQIAEKKGIADTAGLIYQSPLAAGSSQITSAISSNFVTNGGPGAETVSLRGLGANRTLVLLNGKRAGPAGTRGSVSSFDLNVLPESVVKSVQVLKDGASSVYGSDAIAGVINIITKTDTDGIELDGFSSPPMKSGGEVYRLTATWGKSWSSGHVLLSADYYQQNELARGQRDYLRCSEDYIFTKSGSRADLIDPRTGKPRCNDLPWGQVWLYDYSALYGYTSNVPGSSGMGDVRLFQPTYNDNLGQYIPGLAPGAIGVPAGFYPVGYDAASLAVENNYHPFYDAASVQPKTTRFSLYADASYKISDDIELYADYLFNRRYNYTNAFRQIWNFGLSESFGDPTGAGWTGPATLSGTAITDHFDSSQVVYYNRGVAGVRGSTPFLGHTWNWDVYGQYSSSIGKYSQEQTYQDAIDEQTLGFGCTPGEVTPISGHACIDIPWYDPAFLAGQITPAEQNYLFGWDTGRTLYTEAYVEGSINGTLLDLPAGPLGIAIGSTWRRDTIHDVPGDIVYAPDPNNPGQYVNNAWGVSSSGVTAGHTDTKEAFAEVNIPLIHDTPFIQEFNINAAGRVTDVYARRNADGQDDSNNGNWTYKVGANWQVNDWLRFRGSYGTSFRAPALFEEFLANQSGFQNQRNVDPCINWGQAAANHTISDRVAAACAADGVPAVHSGTGTSATVYTGGNVGHLKPETSTALSFSEVLTPKFAFLPNTRLSVAIDYFDIKVNGEISQLGPYNIIYGCYSSDSAFPTDPLCSLYSRDPATHNITSVTDNYLNIASQRNRGVDVTVNVGQDIGTLGNLNFQGEMTWQSQDTSVLLPGSPAVDENGQAGEPIWVGNFNLQWDTKHGTTFFYGLDVVGGTSSVRDFIKYNGDTCVTSATLGAYCEQLRASPTFYHSVSVTQDIGDKFELTLGMYNIFDTKPPRVSTNSGVITTLGQSSFYSQYDLLGRRIFVQAKAKF